MERPAENPSGTYSKLFNQNHILYDAFSQPMWLHGSLQRRSVACAKARRWVSAEPVWLQDGCTVAQGYYRWMHDQVLKWLAEHTFFSFRVLENRNPQCHQKHCVQFYLAGEMEQNCPTPGRISVLTPGNDLSMGADFTKQLKFLSQITTSLKPDIVLEVSSRDVCVDN